MNLTIFSVFEINWERAVRILLSLAFWCVLARRSDFSFRPFTRVILQPTNMDENGLALIHVGAAR